MVQEYRLESRWIIFGSGEMAHFEDVRERIIDGDPVVDFIITPDDFLKDRYSLKVGDEISREDGLMIRTYPKEFVTFLPIVSGNQLVLVKTNLLGESTAMSQENLELQHQVKYLRRECKILSSANMRLLQKYETMTTRYEKFFKKDKELFQQAQFSAPKEESNED